MSKVFKCDTCPRRTTEPYIIYGQKLCPICAEEVAPNIVASRERWNYQNYSRGQWIDKGFGRDRRPER